MYPKERGYSDKNLKKSLTSLPAVYHSLVRTVVPDV